MVTVTETSTRTLSSSDEIAAFLEQRFAQMLASSPFKPGEAVHIANRAGLPTDLGAGDVGLMLLDVPGAWSHVMLLSPTGLPIVVQVASGNLAKRGSDEAPVA
ncbi:hypothetical protein E4V01_24085 [Methylorubrum sp. Q1]|uniref:hypothetical protein n=1 Tax=Methylorubrum sp. Q1 TaxID=2562453 RepID=UPI0010761393|nr:hypothetical protein [Methylorubrum sp. Q1]TFZ54995.1 hypothetical protein E4V01_24085 [Methylorubrum sp. Q1]